MKKKSFLGLLLLVVLLAVQPGVVFAQENAYSVHLSRNFGYGGGQNIRGTFTISLVGDEIAVQDVRFVIDGETMADVSSAPFNFKFQTDDYGFGNHQMWAEATLKDGTSLTTPAVQYNFVSPEEEREQMGSILGFIGGGLVLTLLVVGLIQGALLKGSKNRLHQPGEPRNYGMLGGTICPKCGRPFPRHLFGIKLIVGRLDRCDNCGKWVMTTRASQDALQAAEETERAELAADEAVTAVKADKSGSLDDTRYMDDL